MHAGEDNTQGDELREWRCVSGDGQGGSMLQTAVRERAAGSSSGKSRSRGRVVEHLCIRTYAELGNKDYEWLFADGY